MGYRDDIRINQELGRLRRGQSMFRMPNEMSDDELWVLDVKELPRVDELTGEG
jgi:hypothetical protein